MDIAGELSLYPLNAEYIPPIKEFIERLNADGRLKVVTNNLRPGYFRRNGAPYGKDAVVTEYFDLNTLPNGDTLEGKLTGDTPAGTKLWYEFADAKCDYFRHCVRNRPCRQFLGNMRRIGHRNRIMIEAA